MAFIYFIFARFILLVLCLFNFKKNDYSYIKYNFYYIIIIQNSYIYIISIILLFSNNIYLYYCHYNELISN